MTLILMASLLGLAAAAPATAGSPTPLPAESTPELEPNDAVATATPILNGVKIRGDVAPAGDIDWYRVQGAAGSRLYAAIVLSPSAAADPTLTLFKDDAVTVIETDRDDGTYTAWSPVIAGARLPTTGTYYLRVTSGMLAINYDLYVHTRSGAPVTEVEPNEIAAPQALGAALYVTGNHSVPSDVDAFSIDVHEGDTLFASLDLDPERDGTEWNGRLAMGPFAGVYQTVDDVGLSDFDAEADFATVRSDGTITLVVDAAGTETGTYTLSVLRLEASHPDCISYPGSGPLLIDDVAETQSPLTVPQNFVIGRMAVKLSFTHDRLPDVDAVLRSPSGTAVPLLMDTGTAGAPSIVNVVIDSEAALPVSQGSTIVADRMLRYDPRVVEKPLLGTASAGTWTLSMFDDGPGFTGVLNTWYLVLCEEAAAPALPPEVLFETDFEADDGGFTHTGTQDEWERGTPTFAPIQTCASGTTCWVTDLDNTYNASSDQSLWSPPIDLTNVAPPVTLSYAQKFDIESFLYDRYTVQARAVGGSETLALFAHENLSMFHTVGATATTVSVPDGWRTLTADLTPLIGQTVQLRWRLRSDPSVQRPGVAIDDVSVHANPGLACSSMTMKLREDRARSALAACSNGLAPYDVTIDAPPARGVATGGAAVGYAGRKNFNGTDAFTTLVRDSVGVTKPMSVAVAVKPINDAPRFRRGPDQAVPESAGRQSVRRWARKIAPGPRNEASQQVTFKTRVTGRKGGIRFAWPPSVSPDGRLRYTVAKGSVGVATIAVWAVDDGPRRKPNVNRSAEKIFTIRSKPAT
jgi:subtilisin-like proprotein convertase family protein